MSDKESTSLVPRSEYAPAVRRQIRDAPYNPVLHKGMRNPYTGRVITCESEYLEYQREHVYHRLCDDTVRRRYSSRLRAVCALLAVLLLAVSLLLFWYIPRATEDSYHSGLTAGFTEGYVAGGAGVSGGAGGHSTVREGSTAGSPGTTSPTQPRSGATAFTIVYVSRSGHKIHLRSNCSGMINYDTMTYAEALAAGYTHCSKCF